MTKQRQIILEELCKLRTHPAADELYPLVREKLPRVSLATVYRNLNLLANQGVISKLEHGSMQKRFDGKAQPHYHFRCSKCGKLYDLTLSSIGAIKKAATNIHNHQIQGYHLEFFGICNSCIKEN